MQRGEYIILISVVLALAGLSAWLNFVVLAPKEDTAEVVETHDPDYYIENFTSTGRDAEGRSYVLEAERLVHFPDDGSALLDYPHVIQYVDNQAPRHAYADSGWLSGDGEEIQLTGNVKVIQGFSTDINAGGITTTESMKIRLKQRNKS